MQCEAGAVLRLGSMCRAGLTGEMIVVASTVTRFSIHADYSNFNLVVDIKVIEKRP